jgi:hypothetical protein
MNIDDMITYLEGLEPGGTKPLWSFNEIFAEPGVDQSHYPWDGSVESLLAFIKTFGNGFYVAMQYPFGYIYGSMQGTDEHPKCVVTLHHPLSSGGDPRWYGIHGDLAIAIAISILEYKQATANWPNLDFMWKRSTENEPTDSL